MIKQQIDTIEEEITQKQPEKGEMKIRKERLKVQGHRMRKCKGYIISFPEWANKMREKGV